MVYFAWGLACGLLAAIGTGWWMSRRLRRLARRARRLARKARRIQHRRLLRLKQAQRLAELGTLTGGLAHEIKNPLSTVQLNLQLLQEDLLPENPAYSRICNRLNVVQREAGRLRDILDDFLRYAGKVELNRRPVDLNRLLEELVDFFTPQARTQQVRLRQAPFTSPLVARVDERLIKQAILNLMLNAVQAMSENRGQGGQGGQGGEGGEGGELLLSTMCDDRAATIHVIDTGPGIAPEAVEKIFSAYYSTKKGGTGLGLAMTRRIIEEHGGRIVVRSEPGKGSDFAVRLPLGG